MKIFDLAGKTAIVTGGNGGIGLAMARGLAEAGAQVVLMGRDGAKGAAAVGALEEEGLAAHFVEVDVTAEDRVAAAVEEAARIGGRIDILVNNAGIAIRKLPQDYTLGDWHKVLDTNLTSAFLMSQAVYPALCRAGGGKIINIASVLALLGAPFSVAYSASKGGLVQFTRALATAWAPDNIQVNAILPGWIETELTVQARAQVPGLNDNVLSRTPARRWGAPGDFAGPAVFLASSASDFVTGASLVVDGGFTVQG
ncbi:glucose 1-dehydrogenase [Cereibacter azotoformans]|uniref:Short-chain dehydrogenase/reductase SDR n=1 Tax=Cereibacter sphaeroides (strain ATCC 17025 / ATH 2.4.3) TaxID=349102 RepID=A4WST4_CERS5|nr:glucose 1-dehydrogenase [Cereibacter azotoformans]ULB09749.1 glucose 1-dehydrogenase [Cereibacter azotoformans]